MKEMNYDYLQSKPRSGKTSFSVLGISFEDVMNLPIKYLNLENYTKELFENKIFYNNNNQKKLLTIGDLVNLGYTSAKLHIQRNLSRGTTDVMYSLQLALAKFSLKLKDTDFTVFEIKTEDINLSNAASKWAKKNKLNDIGDFYINGKQKLKELADDIQKNEIKNSVLAALKHFGIFLEKKLLKEIKNNDGKSSNEEIISCLFPDILRAIKIENEKAKKIKFIGLEIFDNLNYSNTECDYSKLISLIRLNFNSTSDFMAATNLSKVSIDKIVQGKELEDKTLKKAYNYFKVSIADIVTFNTTKIKRSANAGVGDKYNFSKLFIRLRNMYGSRDAFCKAAGIPKAAIKSLAMGKLLSYKNMRKICKALRCDLNDIMEIISQDTMPEQENIETYYDYSKFKELLKKKGLSINKLLSDSKISRNYVGSLISSGKPLNSKHLKVLTSLLNCSEEDLYTIKTGKNPFIDCDYSKLLKLLENRMISVNELCKKTGLNSQEIFKRMSLGKHLGQEKVDKITQFLNCKEEDIIINLRSREDVKENRRKAMKRLEPEVDFSKLYEKMEQENLTLDELCKKLSFTKLFKDSVRRSVKLEKTHITKLCRYFKCKPEELFTPFKNSRTKIESENIQSKINNEQPACDYTDLLNIAVQRAKFLQDFMEQVGIHRNYVTKINKGQLLDFRIYKKIMDFLNMPLDKLVKFKNIEDREKILIKIKKAEENKNNKEVDYSGLYKMLSEKNLTDSELFRYKIVSFNIVLYKIREGKDISTDTVKRICKYLNCEPNDIMKRIKPKKQNIGACNPENPEVDYSILISIVNKRFLNLTQICRDVGIGIHFAHSIKKGKKIGKNKLEKICAYIGRKPEEIVFEIKKNEPISQTPQNNSFVNISFGEGVARVKPALLKTIPEKTTPKTSEQISQPIETIENNSNNVGGSNISTKPAGTKFYFTPNGYIKHPEIKFKSLKVKTNKVELESENELTF